MKRLLVQTQLSNYTADGLFILECDSGWQMAANRVRTLLQLVPDLRVDVTGPSRHQLITQPEALVPEFKSPSIRYISHYVPPNALLSRHHFNTEDLRPLAKNSYDAAYINDPMHFRNFKALLADKCKLYAVHNHFVDNPSCPKFPAEMSLWLGQCEAVRRADVNFWQCESALHAFEGDYGYKAPKSFVWDDGYSIAEITSPANMRNIRFDSTVLAKRPIIFVPNRVGGRGVSSDYTNCGKFLFEILPQLRATNLPFSVVAGNPSQKFSNKQLVDECGVLPLTLDAFTRDEYKCIAASSSIVVALYDKDTYGGTAVRECIEVGCLPLWLECNEYESISKEAEYPFLCKTNFSDVASIAAQLLTLSAADRTKYSSKLRAVVRRRCAIEHTTKDAAEKMGLI